MGARLTITPESDEPYALSAAPLIPSGATMETLREIAAGCQACHLWRHATQTVFGEGPPSARLMLVGEQPGDMEDRAGQPFVGPAGRILNEALDQAGLERDHVYITNVVKHFKSELRGSRRLHKKPNGAEIRACRPWLDAEIQVVAPKTVVCLGATAAQALLGPQFRVTRQRGEFIEGVLPVPVLATVHPASIVRIPDEGEREEEKARFAEDLKKVASMLGASR